MDWIKKRDNYTTLLIILIFLILPFIFFNDTFDLVNKVQGTGDTTAIAVPIYELRMSLVKELEFPFWNIFNYSGYPLYGYIEMNPFYPITLFFGLLFSIPVSFNLSILFHYSLAGIFMFLLLRELKLKNIPAFAGSMIFMFSGIMITQRSHPWQIFTVIWFPLILVFLEKYRKRKRFYLLFLASIIYAISFLGGSPQLFLYGSIILLGFILFHSFTSFEGRRDYIFLSALIIFVIGPLLVSFQIFPTIELMHESVRENISYTFFSDYSFNFKMLPVLISPFIFGNPFFSSVSLSKYLGSWNYNEMVIYFGLITFPIMILGTLLKDKRKWFWISLMLLSVVLVLGRSTPLYRIMYYIPIYNIFRVPARNWFEFGFSFSILCSFGFNYLMTETDSKKVKTVSNILSGIFIFILVIFSSMIIILNTKLNAVLIENIKVNTEKLADVFTNITIKNYAVFIPLIFISVTIIVLLLMRKWWKKRIFITVLIVMVFLDLFCFGHFFEGNTDSPIINRDVETYDELDLLENSNKNFRIYPVIPSISGKVFANNKNIFLNSDVVTGYTPLLLKDYNHITGIRDSSDDIEGYDNLIRNIAILSMLNTKFILIDEDRYSKLVEDDFSNMLGNYKIVKSEDEKLILENQKAMPRFYYVENIIVAGNQVEVKNILWREDQNFNFTDSAILLYDELTDNDIETIYEFNSIEQDKVQALPEIIEYKNNSSTLKTSNDRLSFLVFSDSYFPGWRVKINDKIEKIYRANGILKGIFIPPGENTITFFYLPTNLKFYILISCLIFIGMLLICVFERRIKNFFKLYNSRK